MPLLIKIAQIASAMSIVAAIIVCLVNFVMTGRSGRVWLLLTAALAAEFLVVFRDVVDIWIGFGPFADVFAKLDYMSVTFTFLFAIAAHQFISYKQDELLRAFGASQTAKQVLESSLGAMGDGFEVIGPDSRVIYSNLDSSEIECKTSKKGENGAGDTRGVGEQLVLATFKSGVVSRGEELVECSGSRRVLDMVVSPIISGDGQILACVRVARDITEMKQMQEAIRDANLRLEDKVRERTAQLESALRQLRQTHDQLLQSEKLAALGKITGGLTHNIANPLSVLGPKLKLFGDYFSHIDRILREYCALHELADPDAINEKLSSIAKMSQEGRGIAYYQRKLNRFVVPCVKEVHKIEKIVQDLVDYSRMNRPEVEPIEINEQIRLVVSLLEYEFRRSDIRIETDYAENLKPVECYAAEMNQVITNLLINSVDAISAKQRIDPEMKGLIKIATEGDDSLVKISIEDNGIGVNKEDISKVFDPFFTTKPTGGSLGLGLSVSAGIIEKHGGNIQLDSTPGEYSRFVITLRSKLPQERLREEYAQ
ncbi:MAG: ATP-binding protein [Candidatus Coatesbacteria bacterium]|nr:ATP-binding protein [Candidatus Coatesbacteria bacterium]